MLDLGSGAGFDCSIAAREVGPEGHVIGVDMTPEMVEDDSREFIREWDADRDLSDYLLSATITGRKPAPD